MTKSETTLIIGAYGYGNMGDEAILQGILEEMADRKDVEALSATPEETERLHGIKAVSLNNIDRNKYSTVILGGGGYRPGNYKIPLKICLDLKERGAKLIVKAIGPTPEVAGKDNFGTGEMGEKEKQILNEVIKKADYFSVRTQKDLARMKKHLSIEREIKVETDPALNISFSKEQGRELLQKFGFPPEKKLCGICLAKFGYRERLLKLLREYQGKFILVPIPMCRHYYAGFENDILLLRRYFRLLGCLDKHSEAWLKYPFTPSELKGVLANLTYLVTARKHAMILAVGGGLKPEQILLLGTGESGLAEHFNVKETDWREWPRTFAGSRFTWAKNMIDIKDIIRRIKNKLTKMIVS